MKDKRADMIKSTVIVKQELRLLASSKLEAKALKAASRSLTNKSYDTLKIQRR